MSHLFYDEGAPAAGRKVLLATSSYGSPDPTYTYSIARSREALSAAGIPSGYMLLVGFCHVDDARNAIVREFLKSDCSELLFLDADVSWTPEGIVQLCKRDLDLVGGVYPYRRESQNMPVRLLNTNLPDESGLLEVEGLPTGFMKINRRVLEQIAKCSLIYLDKTEDTPQVFERLTGGDKTRWGGDIAFCNKWRDLGGKIYADTEIRLGHAATVIYRDSLGAYLRRNGGLTLDHLVPKFRAGIEQPSDYDEVFQFGENEWAADPEVLALCVGLARKCRGPIIETGSGLSSVLMAVANPEQEVHALEHLELYAERTKAMAKEAGADNLTVHCVPSNDYWYDLGKTGIRHSKFAFGFCDGPPRMFGTRWRFFEELAPKCMAIAVDDYGTDYKYAGRVNDWAAINGRNVQRFGRAALLMKAA